MFPAFQQNLPKRKTIPEALHLGGPRDFASRYFSAVRFSVAADRVSLFMEPVERFPHSVRHDTTVGSKLGFDGMKFVNVDGIEIEHSGMSGLGLSLGRPCLTRSAF